MSGHGMKEARRQGRQNEKERQTKHDNVSCQEILKEKNDRDSLKRRISRRHGK
jgi:hypothetical protein